MTSEQLAIAFHSACMAELQAIKPGNVHVFADGHGMTIHDFIKSADVSAAEIAKPNLSVGERIFNAVEATQAAVGLNTNLGIILLCAPLIHAALLPSVDGNQSLQQRLVYTLNQLSVNDGLLTAQAIMLANPAGLGSSSVNDVYKLPNVTLLEMMASAQHRDRIAWQYANNFLDVFDLRISKYAQAVTKWQDSSDRGQNRAWATTALYLSFLARQLDSHVVRKHGEALAKVLMQEAIEMEAIYWATDNPKLVQKQLLAWDASLKSRNMNPGTSADLTVATLLVDYFD
ncbi:MAG: triphosphoribosyl-dephospho-CoA synthase [Methylotenera sp.]|nr:triphosphoribosyl-dephospho-CoA synthase [Methylotenera sp.]